MFIERYGSEIFENITATTRRIFGLRNRRMEEVAQ
jgi:hypothetical protein